MISHPGSLKGTSSRSNSTEPHRAEERNRDRSWSAKNDSVYDVECCLVRVFGDPIADGLCDVHCCGVLESLIAWVDVGASCCEQEDGCYVF